MLEIKTFLLKILKVFNQCDSSICHKVFSFYLASSFFSLLPSPSLWWWLLIQFVSILQIFILCFILWYLWIWNAKGRQSAACCWFSLRVLLIVSDGFGYLQVNLLIEIANQYVACGTHTMVIDIVLLLGIILYLPYDFSLTSFSPSQSSSSFPGLQYPRLSYGSLNPCSSISKRAGSSLYY